MRQKNLARRGPAATIAKPIRAGQPHVIAGQPTIRTGINTPVKSFEEQKRRSVIVGDKGKGLFFLNSYFLFSREYILYILIQRRPYFANKYFAFCR